MGKIGLVAPCAGIHQRRVVLKVESLGLQATTVAPPRHQPYGQARVPRLL